MGTHLRETIIEDASGSVDVTTSETTVIERINTQLGSLLNVEVQTATQNLNTFKLQLRSHPDGEWFDYLSGTDFNTATSNLPFAATNNPATLSAGSSTHFIARIRGAESFRMRASAASGTAVVNVKFRLVSE